MVQRTQRNAVAYLPNRFVGCRVQELGRLCAGVDFHEAAVGIDWREAVCSVGAAPSARGHAQRWAHRKEAESAAKRVTAAGTCGRHGWDIGNAGEGFTDGTAIAHSRG